MVKRSKQNIEQHDVESLANILEDWLALIGQMQVIQENLSHIPEEIEILRQYLNYELSQAEVNIKMQSVLNSLEAQLPKLLTLEEKVNNSIALREIIEALQQKIKGDLDDNYEISFKKAKVNRNRFSSRNKSQGFTDQKSISQRITQFWDKNYLKISIGVGITTVAGYSLFLCFSDRQLATINIDRTESKVEQLY